VLLAEDGGHFDDPARGIAYRISGKSWVNNHAHVIRPKAVLDIGFLCRVLENYDVRPFISGTTRSKLTKGQAEKIGIPVPPLPEQRRIAAILDQADELRRQRNMSLEILDDLKAAVFFDMFVRCEDASWPTQCIGDLAIDMRTGPFGSQLLHSEFVDDGIAVLGIDNAVKNEFSWDQRRFITEEKYRTLRRFTVHPGDVLITIMGTCGRCAVVPADIPLAINTKHLCCITLDADRAVPEFVHASLLMHPGILRQLGVLAKGAVMPGLNMGIIRSLEMKLPPIARQQAFLARVSELEALRRRFRRHGERLGNLFHSLQHRAFSGQLTARQAERELELAG
jgi:type I restriction enzyme S subunit